MKYWKKHFNNKNVVGNTDYQKNVERTKSGIPVPDSIWNKTLIYIEKLLALNKDTTEVLELCCGNGQIIGNLASKCKRAVGVDFSEKLLYQLRSQFGNAVLTYHYDVLKIHFEAESFDIIIIYFSLQHFNESESVQLIQNALDWLRKGGRLFIGDVPNETKKWNYIDKPEYRKDYIKRIMDNRPMIGTWFHPDFFKAIGLYLKKSVQIIEQPAYQINSNYRFDVLITK